MAQLDRQKLLQMIARLEPVVAQEGCELLDARSIEEGFRHIVRLFIDKNSGVTVDDCARVSRAVEDVIEVEGFVDGAFHLEVSSPGIERPLRTAQHFSRVLGKVVNVTTTEKIDGRRRYKGVLQEIVGEESAGDAALKIIVDDNEFCVPVLLIERANLVYEWK